MARWMPRLEAFFHYRNLDVSTLKELARRWNPAVYRSFEKKSRHEALADIYESIDELRHYRTHWLRRAHDALAPRSSSLSRRHCGGRRLRCRRGHLCRRAHPAS